MRITIDSEVAQRYGLAGATVLGYLQYRHQHHHDPEGRFTAPHSGIQKAFRITRQTFDSWRNKMEEDGLIYTERYPQITLYHLNQEAIAKLEGKNHEP